MTESSAQGPEFTAGELTGARLIDTIEAAGAAVIRGCLDGHKVRAMLARAEDVYRKRELEYRRDELNATQRRLFEFGNITQSDLDLPNDQFALIRFALRSGLQPLVSGLWGGRVAFLQKNCIPRRQAPDGKFNSAVPFHQDASFLAMSSLVLNFWIPLVPCGVSAPGLEVVLGNPHRLLRHLPSGACVSRDYREIELAEDSIVSQWGRNKLWHPALEQGDVFVFSNLTVHRTYLTPAMTETRISLELRCGDAANAELRAAHPRLVEVKFDKMVA